MMIRLCFMYVLYLGIYSIVVSSYQQNYTDVIEDLEHDKLGEEFMILHRFKRAGPSNTSNTTNTVYTGGTFTSSFASTMGPTPYSTMNRAANISYTYIITGSTRRGNISQINSTITTTASPYVISSYNPDTCSVVGLIRLVNNTCVPKIDGQNIATSILRNSSRTNIDAVDALALYVSAITNSTSLTNITNTLSVIELDNIVDNISDINITINANTSFLMVQQPYQDGNRIVLGASFTRGIGGEIVDTSNKDNITQSSISAAAIINPDSLNGVISLNLLIIDKPTGYENADNSTDRFLSSSVIVANLRRNSSVYSAMNISLYFKILEEYKQNGNGNYSCVFYDPINHQWNGHGCTNVSYNVDFHRYECHCNHLTSFALIWLPETLTSNTTSTTLSAQDIASLVFQAISILCFLAIMLHAIIVRIRTPRIRLQTLRLLPLISTASTTILFIFFLALGVTVYTNTSSTNETECFLSSKVLMFITYYLLIYMFCVKTSAGYFYYLRFVRLFPHPSHRQLILMLLISFLISIICVAVAIGLSFNSTLNIIKLYPYEICWFTTDVIYYFLTIPIGIFLLLNIIIIILVARSLINHALNATTSELVNQRMKRCVIVLLSSCVTQGIGWLFGPFISFINPIAGNILGWFFILVNGLEGFWSIVLYSLIRAQQLDEQKHLSAAKKFQKSVGISSNKDNRHIDHDEDNDRTVDTDTRKKRSSSFNDIRKRDPMDTSNDYDDKRFN